MADLSRLKAAAKGLGWLAVGLAALVILAAPLPVRFAAPAERTIRIEASRFQYAPAEMHVNPGDRVTLEVISKDVVHGLSIEGYNLNLSADPGQTSRLTFTADRPGMFRFRCSMTCGSLHPFMTGKLYVGPNTLLWRAAALAVLSILAGLWMLWK